MEMCKDVITVFNAQFDQEKDMDVYHGTIISGVSWFGDVSAVVDPATGLKAANNVRIRIPVDAEFSGKAYVDPVAYETSDPASTFTLKAGCIIVKGIMILSNPSPAALHRLPDAVTVLGVTDNRRARNAPHWRVVGT